MKTYCCKTRHSLREIAKLLTEPLGLSGCEFEYENVYEWFQAKGASRISWNVSRKHDGNGESSFDDFLIITPSPLPSHFESVGQQLAETLLCPIGFGNGGYLASKGSEYWDFSEERRFLPND